MKIPTVWHQQVILFDEYWSFQIKPDRCQVASRVTQFYLHPRSPEVISAITRDRLAATRPRKGARRQCNEHIQSELQARNHGKFNGNSSMITKTYNRHSPRNITRNGGATDTHHRLPKKNLWKHGRKRLTDITNLSKHGLRRLLDITNL
jgi:hypothetical protein